MATKEEEEEEEREGWEALPVELLLNIFMRLRDHYGGEHAVMQVCRSWYLVAHHKDLLTPRWPHRREYTKITKFQGFRPEGGMYSFFPNKTLLYYDAHMLGLQTFQFMYYREKGIQTMGMPPPVWSSSWHHLSDGIQINATYPYLNLEPQEVANAVRLPEASEDAQRDAVCYFQAAQWWLSHSAWQSLQQTPSVLRAPQEDRVEDEEAHHGDPLADHHVTQGVFIRP